MVAGLWARRDMFKPVAIISLMSNGIPTAILNDWKPALRVIAAIKNELAARDNGDEPDIISVDLEAIKARSTATALQGTPERMRFHLPLVTSPRAFLYHEGQAFSPSVGVLTFVPLPHVAANFGQEVRIHLIVDVLPKAPSPL